MNRTHRDENMEILTEGIRKMVIEPGSGPTVPEDAVVVFHYSVYEEGKPDEPIESTWLRNAPCRSTLGDLTLRGLAIALRTMCRGERCRVVVTPEFGDLGHPPLIPPRATLVYDVLLISFLVFDHEHRVLDSLSPTEVRSLRFEDVYNLCELSSRLSNGYYDLGDFASALHYCELAKKMMGRTVEPEDQAGRDCRKNALTTLLANEAQCALRARDYERAVQCCREALQINPNHIKALYRGGVALRNLGDMEGAADMLRRARALMPLSHQLESELVHVEEHLQAKSSEVNLGPASELVPVRMDLALRDSTAVAARSESKAVSLRMESSFAYPEYLRPATGPLNES